MSQIIPYKSEIELITLLNTIIMPSKTRIHVWRDHEQNEKLGKIFFKISFRITFPFLCRPSCKPQLLFCFEERQPEKVTKHSPILLFGVTIVKKKPVQVVQTQRVTPKIHQIRQELSTFLDSIPVLFKRALVTLFLGGLMKSVHCNPSVLFIV